MKWNEMVWVWKEILTVFGLNTSIMGLAARVQPITRRLSRAPTVQKPTVLPIPQKRRHCKNKKTHWRSKAGIILQSRPFIKWIPSINPNPPHQRIQDSWVFFFFLTFWKPNNQWIGFSIWGGFQAAANQRWVRSDERLGSRTCAWFHNKIKVTNEIKKNGTWTELRFAFATTFLPLLQPRERERIFRERKKEKILRERERGVVTCERGLTTEIDASVLWMPTLRALTGIVERWRAKMKKRKRKEANFKGCLLQFIFG